MEYEQLWQVILNPHAGSGKGKKDRERIEKIIRESGIKFLMHTSDYPGHAVLLAGELASEGHNHFIIAGGDGTLNEVVNGIFQDRRPLPNDIVIGMLPVGTGNDWAKTFGIPDDYEDAMNLIIAGKMVTQDLGEIIFTKNHLETSRYFANIAGFGFDALVAGKANELKSKGKSGLMVYIQSLFTSFVRFKSETTLIDIDDLQISRNLFSASIGIGRYNGGGMMQVPEANPTQGIFHITLISRIGIAGILKNLRGLYTGKFISDPRVSTFVGKNIRIKPINALVAEADGEQVGTGDFLVRILPHQLTVICGETEFE